MNKTGLFMAVILISGAICGQAHASVREPSVRVSVDRRAILIGDRILYRIEASCPKGMEAELPEFKGHAAGDFEIKESGQKSERLFFGGNRYVNWYEITSYAPGKYKTPAVSVRYKDAGAGGEWKAKGLNQIEIIVESVLPRDREITDIKDIKGPVWPFEINYWLIGGILAGIAVFIAAMTALIRYMTRVPPKTPYEIALAQLDEAKLALDTGSGIKEYYIRVSDCIRRYIESVFGLHAPEMTTQEFLDSLRNSDKLPDGYKHLMKDFMEACDLVKFAKYVPAMKEAESVLLTAKNFIEGNRAFRAGPKGKG